MQDILIIPEWMRKKDPEFSIGNAKDLINNYCIRKHDTRKDEVIIYRMVEIESYYYSVDDEKNGMFTDINTIIRNCKAGEWFFHDYGVDIAYETIFDSGNEEELRCFGGILIRGIEIYKHGEDGKWFLESAIPGPRLCMQEIFSHTNEFPKIQLKPDDVVFENTNNIIETKRIGFAEETDTPNRRFLINQYWKKGCWQFVEKEKENREYSIKLEKRNKYYNPKPKIWDGNNHQQQ